MIDIRPASVDDISIINNIINEYIQHTTAIFDVTPWERSKRINWFSQFDFKNYFIFVAEMENKIIGFAYNSRFMEKQAYDISSEVSIYLSMNSKLAGQGIGSKLYNTLFNEINHTNIHRLYARIALPNDASIQLHKKYGFKQVGILNQCGYKLGQYIDVALLEQKVTHQ
jgi:phosphinothricin acetyltransferase